MYLPICMNIRQWESCVQSGCSVCSQSIKNNNALTIQRIHYKWRKKIAKKLQKKKKKKKKKKTATSEEKELFHQDNAPCHKFITTMTKTTWIALWIASTPTLLSRSGPQQLLAVCRPQKNAPGKEIWLQWRSDIRNRDVFWGQRQIVLQKASNC